MADIYPKERVTRNLERPREHRMKKEVGTAVSANFM
jgi:hypothetical protein